MVEYIKPDLARGILTRQSDGMPLYRGRVMEDLMNSGRAIEGDFSDVSSAVITDNGTGQSQVVEVRAQKALSQGKVYTVFEFQEIK